MKEFTLFLLIGLFACTNRQPASDTGAHAVPAEEPAAPFTASYSSRFSIADARAGRTVLQAWKNWDNDQVAASIAFLADTLELDLPDGTYWRGPRDSVWANVLVYRSMFSEIKSEVLAWAPLRADGKDETWVVIWGKEYQTWKESGKKDTVGLHEIWTLNPKGQITGLRQYDKK